MKKIKKHKAIHKIIFVLLILFFLFNIAWLTNNTLYNKYITSDYEKFITSYGKHVLEYNYTVKKPRYFSFKGNLAISHITDKRKISLIIWPSLVNINQYQYGFIIYDNEIDHGYIFYVDKNLNFLETSENNFTNEDIKKIRFLLKKYDRDIKKIYELSKKEWNF